MSEHTMSEHAWVQENVAAYLAGGLDAQEAERLEAHARDCPECGAALAGAQQLDEGLSTLFAGVRPDLGLADRVIARMRTAPSRWPQLARRAKWAGAIAAVLLLGVIGALASSLALIEREAQLVIARKDEQGGGSDRESARLEAAKAELRAKANRKYTGRGVEGTYELEYLESPPVDGFTTFDPVGQPSAPNTDETTFALPGLFARGYSPPNVFAYDVTGGRNGQFSASYNGRSGSTKTKLISEGYAVPGESFDPVKSRPELPKPVKTNESNEPNKPGDPAGFKQPVDPKKVDPVAEPQRRVVLRSGDMEFEVESFDSAAATVTKLTLGIKGAFVATVNSDKLPNGKVKGSITVRVPPEQLDGLVLDLRRELSKGGELKGLKLTSQDVTKMYTDLESRLRAARTMEQRLIQIIKEGKGEIKQLLEAEKELGVWRTKIEEYEGEIRYYANLAAFSTLTITLTEKSIRSAAAITERERVQAGVEVEDVDKAYQQLLTAVVDAKGRITKSELKQLAAGQFNATFHFEVAADASGPIRDRLRMLGRVARLEIDRTIHTEGGTLPSDAKPARGDTVFIVQLYNLANVAPRETVTLQVATTDVPNSYMTVRDAVAKTTGRVLVAQLNEIDRQNISAEIDFEVRRTEEAALRAAIDTAADVLTRQVARAAESDSVTDTKVRYKVILLSASRLKPREVTSLAVEVADVDGSATLFAAQVAEAKGRQVDAKLDRDARGHATATLVFEVPLAAAAGLVERFKGAGTVRVSQTVRDPQATEGKYATARLHVTLTNVEAIVPDDSGLMPKVRRGLSISASVLLTSVTWVVVGLCVALPWAVIGFGGYRIVRRLSRPAPVAPAVAPAAPIAPPPPPAG